MKKDELKKNGYILTLRNGEKLIVGDENDELLNITPFDDDEDDCNRYYDFDEFREDLTNFYTYERDIIKVEKINSNNIVVSLYENATLPELSISEIEEKFKVKVKNEDKSRFYIGDKVKWKDGNGIYYVFKSKDDDGDYYIARNKEDFEECDGYYAPEEDLILVYDEED